LQCAVIENPGILYAVAVQLSKEFLFSPLHLSSSFLMKGITPPGCELRDTDIQLHSQLASSSQQRFNAKLDARARVPPQVQWPSSSIGHDVAARLLRQLRLNQRQMIGIDLESPAEHHAACEKPMSYSPPRILPGKLRLGPARDTRIQRSENHLRGAIGPRRRYRHLANKLRDR
jgi:hypothetical protein